MTDNTQPDHIVDVHEMVTDTNQASELYLLVYADNGEPAMGGGSSTKKRLRVYTDFKEAMAGIKKIRNDDKRKIVIRRYTR